MENLPHVRSGTMFFRWLQGISEVMTIKEITNEIKIEIYILNLKLVYLFYSKMNSWIVMKLEWWTVIWLSIDSGEICKLYCSNVHFISPLLMNTFLNITMHFLPLLYPFIYNVFVLFVLVLFFPSTYFLVFVLWLTNLLN